MRARPLNDRVLVRRIDEGETAKGGIIIPDTAREKPMEGSVVSVGPGKLREDGTRSPMEVQAGNRVLFGKYAGSEIEIGDQEYLIMKEEDILAILTRAK